MQLGSYTLLRKLATGGMGEVFLAVPPDGGRFVAVKRVLPQHQDNEDIVEMFLDEARVATLFDHPNIVKSFEMETTGGTNFLVMEFISGKDLQRICQRGVDEGPFLPIAMACHIISQTAAALHHVHSQIDRKTGEPLHIIHRDVSPPNIMVSFDGEVKLVDFGIAKADTNQAISGDEHLKGKFSYMSPEQVLGDALDGRSDLFTLGTILHEITTPTRLFRAKDKATVKAMMFDEPIPAPSEFDPDYPPELETIVMRALQVDRDKRYQSARAMQQDLDAFIKAYHGEPITESQLANYMNVLFSTDHSTTLTAAVIEAALQGQAPEGFEDASSVVEAVRYHADTHRGPAPTRPTTSPSSDVPTVDTPLPAPAPTATQDKPSTPIELTSDDLHALGRRTRLASILFVIIVIVAAVVLALLP